MPTPAISRDASIAPRSFRRARLLVSCADSLGRDRVMSVRIRQEHVWEEPFRVFFPLGFCIAVVGVLLWPLFFWQTIATYPGSCTRG